ncbi:MAG: tRNA pseudouridine(55) synthase TruB [Burkholderiales bacterium]
MPKQNIDGVLLLDKPVGLSSNAALQHARRLLDAARAGHTGTLDPMASGLLALCFGEATKFASGLLDADKAYRARVRLGVRTATGDAEGEILDRREVRAGRDEVLATLERFRGEIEQVPPMHSAIKHQGRPLYAYARKGQTVERKPRRVLIRELELVRMEGADLDLRVLCSKGTYIRTLAEDIGAVLGCGAHLAALERTAVGPFRLTDAIGLEALAALPGPKRHERLLPVTVLIQSRPRLVLDADAETRFRHGQAVGAGAERGSVGVFAVDGGFLGLGEIGADGLLRPKRLMSLPERAA